MHKNNPAAEIEIANGIPYRITNVLDKKELPIGVYSDIPTVQIGLTTSWYKSRAIPNGRPNIERILKKLGVTESEAFMKTAGISLSDTFWIKKEGSDLSWEDVNFYDNGFESVFAEHYLGANDLSFSPSPDFTTDGLLEKFWISSYGAPFLVKLDSVFDNLQAANEVVASKIAEEIGIPHVSYTHAFVGEQHACICPSFLKNSKEDFITALQLKYEAVQNQTFASIESLLPKKELNKVILFDVLIGNKDRHEKNIGIIGEHLCPVFDNGSCLNYDGKGNDPELKLPRLRRSEALSFCSDIYKVNDYSHIVKAVYKEFQIDKQKTERAIESLRFGTELINSAAREIGESSDVRIEQILQ